MKQSDKMKEKLSEKSLSGFRSKYAHFLILYNDDVNTFDYVMKSLIEVCDHDDIQAEQCTLLVHHKGRCDVKKGSLSKLKTLKDILIERGLKANIE